MNDRHTSEADLCLTCGHACPLQRAEPTPAKRTAATILGRVIAIALLLAILAFALAVIWASLRWMFA